MFFLSKYFSLTALLFGLISLTSCGGGGSNNEDQPPENNTPTLEFSAPNVSAQVSNQVITVSWDESLAERYRVLYWRNNDAPSEIELTTLTYQTPTLSSGQYTILVEAYDELGNSIFSTPISVEVS